MENNSLPANSQVNNPQPQTSLPTDNSSLLVSSSATIASPQNPTGSRRKYLIIIFLFILLISVIAGYILVNRKNSLYENRKTQTTPSPNATNVDTGGKEKELILAKIKTFYSILPQLHDVPMEKEAKKLDINQENPLLQYKNISFRSPWMDTRSQTEKERGSQVEYIDHGRIFIGFCNVAELVKLRDLELSDEELAQKSSQSCGLESDLQLLALKATPDVDLNMSLNDLSNRLKLLSLKVKDLGSEGSLSYIIRRDDGLLIIQEVLKGFTSTVNSLIVYDTQGNHYSVTPTNNADQNDIDGIISTIEVR